MKWKAIIFDLDGTLLNTSEGIKESVEYTIEKLGLPPIPKQNIDRFVGPPIQISLMNEYGITKDEAQIGANIFRTYYKGKALLKAIPYSGIMRVIKNIREQNIKIGIATYKRNDYTKKILRHFGIDQYCDCIHGADNFNKLSKKDIIQLCIDELSIEKDECVMVGDTEYDAKGAHELNIHFIGVTWGFGFSENNNMKWTPAINLVNSPNELLKILINNG